ncbi:MAG TPA: SUMF1/EgtB/PvdO family nonheme iron enzyme, partial [Polyangiaceae bacterium]|nr:SUMF1/EgtB/PvdO family nonheme iron enzyme [Polyangiaceae bacterium]
MRSRPSPIALVALAGSFAGATLAYGVLARGSGDAKAGARRDAPTAKDGPDARLAMRRDDERTTAMLDTRANAPAPAACAEGMTLVEGDFCPRVEQRCLRWMDPPGRFHEYRCAEYARPARCLAPRVRRRFCVDTTERTEADTGLPVNRQSWTDARAACAAAGARVCTESEWTYACEGEEMRPYPYGWSREPTRCNGDRTDLLVPGDHRRLLDHRERAGAHPDCASPFGLLDMAGNVAEWVSVDGFPAGSVVVQKGNWWQPGKQACRDDQPGHDRFYKG